MKHNRLTFLCFMLLLGVTTTLAGEVKVPLWEKFVSINKANVNLRKGPSTSTPRLMISEEQDPDCWRCPPTTEYLWQARQGATPFYLGINTIVPVIRIEGDWLLLYINQEVEAWVRQDFVSEMQPSALPQSKEAYETTTIHKAGNYFFEYFDGYNNTSGTMPQYVKFGRKFGCGILWQNYGEDSSEPSPERELFNWAKTQCGAPVSDDETTYWFRPEKFSAQKIAQWMNSHAHSDGMAISYYFVGFDGAKFESFSFTPSTYKHKMVTQPETYNISQFIMPASGRQMTMRQKPSASAQPLVFVEDPNDESGGDGPGGTIEWDNPKYKRGLVSVLKPEVLPVIGISGDWYTVLARYGGASWEASGDFVAYVAKQDARAVTLQPITTDKIMSLGGGLSIRPTGSYKGYVISWGMVEWLYAPGLFVGKIEGTQLKESTCIVYNEDSQSKTITVNENGLVLRGERFFKKDEWNNVVADFSKLTDDEFGKILRLAGDMDNIYVSPEGAEQLYRVNLSPVNGREVIIK